MIQTNQTNQYHLVTQIDTLLRVVPTPSISDITLSTFKSETRESNETFDTLKTVTAYVHDVLVNGDDSQFDELINYIKEHIDNAQENGIIVPNAIQHTLDSFIDTYDLHNFPECSLYPTKLSINELHEIVKAIPQSTMKPGIVVRDESTVTTDMADCTFSKITPHHIINVMNQYTVFVIGSTLNDR